MQSYKLRKSSETVLFPIENELRLLRQESDKSWTTLMSKILAIVLSGVGTTLLCQDSLLPALVNHICNDVLKGKIPLPLVYILQILTAIGLFVLLSYSFTKFINWKNSAEDNKKGDTERENLAEVFHKIILNNIITGKSFTKKSEEKLRNIKHCMSQESNGNKKAAENQIKALKREFCLYLSEALYYFSIAERQMREKKIIEIGYRKNYVAYLGEIGVLTLAESLLMFKESADKLEQLFSEMKDIDSSIWEENKIESLSINRCLKKIDSIVENILKWIGNLSDTMQEINKTK